MATRKPATKTSSGLLDLLSQHISLRDLITVISVAVSLTLGWGVFTTRITVLEKEVLSLKENNEKNAALIDAQSTRIRKLEGQVQDDQQFIDDLYRQSGRQLPRRYNTTP